MAKADSNQTTKAPSSWAQNFSRFAHSVSLWTGHPVAFLLALAVVIAWVVTGPMFNYSDTWQLVINTGTTIVDISDVILDPKHSESRHARDTAQIVGARAGNEGGGK